MEIKDIYNKFQEIGCLTFATVDEFNIPHTRIAHLRAYDDKGLYFMTMHTKDFYKHLKTNKNISICGLNASTKVEHNNNGLPLFQPGYSIRLNGEVEEVSINEIKEKNNEIFNLCIKDQEKYNAMVVFCITKASGDIFDYDFEKTNRDHKLERIYFSYNKEKQYKGLTINQEKCIKCGICINKCSFNAISNQNNTYSINKNRCDECGDCYISCPKNAIEKS